MIIPAARTIQYLTRFFPSALLCSEPGALCDGGRLSDLHMLCASLCVRFVWFPLCLTLFEFRVEMFLTNSIALIQIPMYIFHPPRILINSCICLHAFPPSHLSRSNTPDLSHPVTAVCCTRRWTGPARVHSESRLYQLLPRLCSKDSAFGAARLGCTFSF
jgi:hypothetical protein